MTQKLSDSGERRTFASGAQRDRGALKPRPDLISPHAAMREGMIYALGAEKYTPRNWERGMPISECMASTQRHIEQWKRGDTDEDHLAQARWNLGAILHYEEEIKAGRLPASLDDMPHYATPKPGDTRIGPSGAEVYAGPVTRPQVIPLGCDPTVEQKIDMSPPTAVVNRRTFYITGPMRGIRYFNFPAFDEAKKLGEAAGYRIISPADLDRQNGGDPLTWDAEKVAAHDEDNWQRHIGNEKCSLDAVIERDLAVIMSLDRDRGDGLAVLGGWLDSKGAFAEVNLAHWRKLNVEDAETLFAYFPNPCPSEDF